MTDFLDPDDPERRFRILADSMPQIVWTARADGWVDYYNQRWYDYTGMTGRETHGWGWGLAVHPENLDMGIQRWQQAVGSGLPFEMLVRIKRKSDGAYRWHLVRALPARDSCGRVVKWFGSSTDIDDIKRQEDNLQRMTSELTRQLEERSQMLAAANEQLLREMHDRRQAEESQEQVTARLNEIIRLQALLAQVPFDVQRFARIVCELAMTQLPAAAAMVDMEDGGELVRRAVTGEQIGATGSRQPTDACARTCLDQGQALLVPVVSGSSGLALAPLYRAGRPVGVLKAVAPAHEQFEAPQLQTLQLLAGLMSAALAIS